jgi:hypothetical protein
MIASRGRSAYCAPNLPSRLSNVNFESGNILPWLHRSEKRELLCGERLILTESFGLGLSFYTVARSMRRPEHIGLRWPA